MPVEQSILTDQTTDKKVTTNQLAMKDENGDLPMNRIKEINPDTDLESEYTKLFKKKKKNRQSFYIVLTLLTTILVALVFAMIGLSHSYHTKANQDSKICTTEDCLRSATSLVEAMDSSVDPCDDFYQFACGRYEGTHQIPKDLYLNNRFIELHFVMLRFIRDFLEKEDDPNDLSSVRKSRLLYRSCIETDKMDEIGLKNLVQILRRTGLPPNGFTANNIEYKNTSLSAILASVKKQINFEYLFSTVINVDSINRTINRITISKSSGISGLPIHKSIKPTIEMYSRKSRETLNSEGLEEKDDLEEYNVEMYRKYFKSVWMEIFKFQSDNFNNNTLKLEYEADYILNFTKDLNAIRNNVYDTDEALPLIMKVDELQLFTDNITHNISNSNERIIDWKEYFTILFKDVENVTLDFETDLIQVYNIEYFEDLFKMLGKTDKNKIVLHIWWEVVINLIPYTTNQMRFIQNRFIRETTGLEYNPSRSVYCANAVNNMMGIAVSRSLLDIDSLDHNIKMVMDMMDNIHWSFEKIVNGLSWMDETTKKRTLNKAKGLKTLVGYPKFIKDRFKLDDFYNNLEVIENDYFRNVIFYEQQDINNTLISLRSINNFDKNSWSLNPLEINACYWTPANTITIPAAILQFPFFGHDLQVLNYGSLGTILGHELTHGFDNTGRQYDQDGNANMWWTNHTIIEFNKRTDCFIKHYETYVVPEISMKVNGKLTLDENIADNGGIREALMAYKKYVADYGEERKLPGLENFSNEQIFFLAFANNWCEATTNASLSRSILDAHSPNYVRVLAGLTNSEEFSEAWKCKIGSRMNPANNKCEIW